MATTRFLVSAALLPLVLGACSMFQTTPRHDPAADAEPAPKQDDRAMYLQLIRQMQQQGAYYASLAHVEAFRLRYGDDPQIRLLQADALRETGQADAADKIYAGLLNGSQAAAAWHGTGLIAAGRGDSARGETALAKAVQLEPLNISYLGDLGFARLRAGDVARAHDPLARAAELAPGNPKATANLALWTLLSGDQAKAEAIMQGAKLPDASRQAVLQLARTLRTQTTQAPTPAADAVAESRTAMAGADAPVAASTATAPVAPAPAAAPAETAAPAPAVAAGVPAPMLDRFAPHSATPR